jgi:hypothetical protein
MAASLSFSGAALVSRVSSSMSRSTSACRFSKCSATSRLLCGFWRGRLRKKNPPGGSRLAGGYGSQPMEGRRLEPMQILPPGRVLVFALGFGIDLDPASTWILRGELPPFRCVSLLHLPDPAAPPCIRQRILPAGFCARLRGRLIHPTLCLDAPLTE